jgi:hypothetical protein
MDLVGSGSCSSQTLTVAVAIASPLVPGLNGLNPPAMTRRVASLGHWMLVAGSTRSHRIRLPIVAVGVRVHRVARRQATLTTSGSLPEDVGMADSPSRRGDRVEWVGPTDNDEMGPRHGERGWVVDMHPMDDVIAWDYSGTLSLP